ISTDTAGNDGGNASSGAPQISSDGRHVLFLSSANNLVQNDQIGHAQLFVRDLVAGATTLVTANQAGTDGGDQAFLNGAPDNVNASYFLPRAISADGRFVAFPSSSDDLVPRDLNRTQDVLERDL